MYNAETHEMKVSNVKCKDREEMKNFVTRVIDGMNKLKFEIRLRTFLKLRPESGDFVVVTLSEWTSTKIYFVLNHHSIKVHDSCTFFSRRAGVV